MTVSLAPTSFGFKTALVVATAAALAVAPGTAQAQVDYTPGRAGVGDPYFPLDGNGGYNVEHYELDVGYEPATDVLTGTATIAATATQNLRASTSTSRG